MSKWIECDVDASTGKPYLWKCDECGEEVETKWNYCPECGDPKTSKGESINTLVKALETEHRKLKEMQSKLGTNLAEVGMDCISRQAAIEVIDAVFPVDPMKSEYAQGIACGAALAKTYVEQLPSAQPEQHIDADGTLWVTVTDIEQVTRVIVDEEKSKFCRQFYMDAQPEPCEDAVSRAEVLRMIDCINDHQAITPYKSVGAVTEHLTRIASSLPPVTPKRGKCKWCERLKERNLRIEYYWIDQEGCTASFSEPHIVATGIANFCPNCGAKMEGDAE